MTSHTRPYIIINSAMSIDGKIASIKNDSRLSSVHDLSRVHALRSRVDAVMVGINTVRIDDPMLNVRYSEGRDPVRIVIDSKGEIASMRCRIMDTCNIIPTLIAVSEQGKDRVDAIVSKGARVIVKGKDRVDLPALIYGLVDAGIRSILVEGGGELNWSLISAGLFDELIVTIAPVILGGRSAKTLVEGEGFATINSARRLSLVRVESNHDSGEVTLYYKRMVYE